MQEKPFSKSFHQPDRGTDMHWILKPFMKTAAYAKLPPLYEEKDRIEAAIQRAKKSKTKVSDLYDMARQNNIQCLKWERWLT
jgi:hypothetical protein